MTTARRTIGNRESGIGNCHRGCRDGFTLVEVLLAIGILAIGVTAVLFLFAMGARSHRRGVDRERAALLADAVFNQVRADLKTTLPKGRYMEDGERNIAPIEKARHADFPEFWYNVRFAKLYNGYYYKVRVEVRWGDERLAAQQHNYEVFETVLPRRND